MPCQQVFAYSATGTRTRVARVRAEYPNQLDYGGSAVEVIKKNTKEIIFSTRLVFVEFWKPQPDNQPAHDIQLGFGFGTIIWHCDLKISDSLCVKEAKEALCQSPNQAIAFEYDVFAPRPPLCLPPPLHLDLWEALHQNLSS